MIGTKSLQRFQMKPDKLQLVGYPADPRFHLFQEEVEKMFARKKVNFQFQLKPLNEVEYDQTVRQLKRASSIQRAFKGRQILEPKRIYKNQFDQYLSEITKKRQPFFMLEEQPIFSLQELSQKLKQPVDFIEGGQSQFFRTKYITKSAESLQKIFSEDKHKSRLYLYNQFLKKAYVFLELQADDKLNLVVIELYRSLAPKACENFIQLCKGTILDQKYFSYLNTHISRIKKNGFIQGGNIAGIGGKSIYGQFFEDECFLIKHDQAGILGMTNCDTPHSNGSQFYITLAPMRSFDGKKVAFGKVLMGLKGLLRFGKLQPSESDQPYTSIRIKSCGPYNHESRTIALTQQKLNLQVQIPKKQEVHFDPRIPNDGGRKNKAKLQKNSNEQLYIAPKLRHFGPDTVTLTTFLIQEQQKIKEATGGLTQLVVSLNYAFRQIKRNLEFQGIGKPITLIQQQSIDIIKDELIQTNKCALLYCLDNMSVIEIPQAKRGKYIVIFRALEIQSDEEIFQNTDTRGTFFLITKKQTTIFKHVNVQDLKISGENILASGYCLFGQCTQIALAVGYSLNIFHYDTEIGDFILSFPRIKMPQKEGIYGVDEAQIEQFDPAVKAFLNTIRKSKKGCTLRYSQSMITNLHRVIMYGGICLYPLPDVTIFECMGILYLLEKAWGLGCTVQTTRAIQMKVSSIEETSKLYFGVPLQIQILDNLYLQSNKN